MKFNVFSKPILRILISLMILLLMAVTVFFLIEKKAGSERAIKSLDPLLKNEDAAQSFSAVSVQTTLSKASDHLVSLKLSGVTESSQEINVESKLSGTIKKIFIKEGAFVKKGSPLMMLSGEDRVKKHAAAQALVKLKEMKHAAAIRLFEKKFASPISLADTENDLAEARLSLAQAELDLRDMTIRAPFDGVVNQIHVEPGSTFSSMSMDRKVASLVNLNPLHLVLYVSEKTYEYLKVGGMVAVSLADGRKVDGKVIYVSASTEPKTRTFKAKVLIPNPHHRIPAGMTAIAEISLKMQHAHKLNPSWITLSKDGVMGVMAVEEGVATFYPVTLLDSSPSYLYVAGLPEEVELITQGQETISSGNRVTAHLAKSLDGGGVSG